MIFNFMERGEKNHNLRFYDFEKELYRVNKVATVFWGVYG